MAEEPTKQNHFYGGQAVVEGVMMRGREVWAVAVRRPAGDVHIESHEIDSVAKRHPVLAKPFLRGVIALGQALAIGYRALSVSARESVEEDERLSSRQMGLSMVIAGVIFIGLFIVLPAVTFGWVGNVDSSVLTNVLEGVFRWPCSSVPAADRPDEGHPRVFAYHGAEHKTIAASSTRAARVRARRSLLHLHVDADELPPARDGHHDLRIHLFGTRGCGGASARGSWRSRSSQELAFEMLRLEPGSRSRSSTRSWCRACGCRR
jgi:hypothetical protein